MATISLVVPAAGCGARAGLNRNKVLVPLLNRPLLWWTLHALCDASALAPGTHVTQLIVAARREEFAEIEAAIASPIPNASSVVPGAVASSAPSAAGAPLFSFFHPATSPSPRLSLHLVEGGNSRQQSVANAVAVASGDFVLVHDAARPLVSPPLIERVLRAALRFDCAIAALPVSDSVKIASPQPHDSASAQPHEPASAQPHESASSEKTASFPVPGDKGVGQARARSSDALAMIAQTLDRSLVYLAQTPQVFRREILDEALHQAARDGFAGTDCSSLVERLRDANGRQRFPIALVAGDERNFKITFAADLERAATWLQDAKLQDARLQDSNHGTLA